MAITEEEIAQARKDTRNEKNQRRMEEEIFGKAQTLPNKNLKKNWSEEIQTLPNKSPKKITTIKDLEDMTTNYRKGGSVGSASKRADGCAQRGKTKGRMI